MNFFIAALLGTLILLRPLAATASGDLLTPWDKVKRDTAKAAVTQRNSRSPRLTSTAIPVAPGLT